MEVRGLYWLYWPHFSHVITNLVNMRAKMMRTIKRSRFKEVSAAALRAVVTGVEKRDMSTAAKAKGSAPLTHKYYFLDLLGSGNAKAVRTPGGSSMYRLH